MRIDHVIVTTRDLDAASQRLLTTHDVGSVAGGVHPSWGTANRIVPAGAVYLELMGVGDAEVAAGSDLGRFVLETSAEGDRMSLVCLRPDDLDATCARLGITAQERSRVTPEGTTIRWRMAGLERALAERLPFFIAWDGPTGADVPDPDEGRRADGVPHVEYGGDVDRLREWIGEDVPGLDLVGGESGVHALTLEVDGDDLVLRGPIL